MAAGARRHRTGHRQEVMTRTVVTAISADLIRPTRPGSAEVNFRKGSLVNALARSRDPRDSVGCGRRAQRTRPCPRWPPGAVVHRTALIVAAKGGTVGDVTAGDVLEVLDAEGEARGAGRGPTVLPDPARDGRLRGRGAGNAAGTAHRRAADARPNSSTVTSWPAVPSVTCWWNTCGNASLCWTTAAWTRWPTSGQAVLGGPGTPSSRHRQPPPAATGSPRRGSSGSARAPRRSAARDGTPTEVSVPRVNYRDMPDPVRAFYLDIAQWALEDPARWGSVGGSLPGQAARS